MLPSLTGRSPFQRIRKRLPHNSLALRAMPTRPVLLTNWTWFRPSKLDRLQYVHALAQELLKTVAVAIPCWTTEAEDSQKSNSTKWPYITIALASSMRRLLWVLLELAEDCLKHRHPITVGEGHEDVLASGQHHLKDSHWLKMAPRDLLE